MAFRDLSEIIEPLRLPINGKTYTIMPVSMADGLRMQSQEEIAALPVEEFRTIFLGPAFMEMIEDGISAQWVSRAALTALTDFQAGRKAAEVMWETGGDPLELAAWVKRTKPTQDRLPPSKRSRKPAVASTTRRRASGSGTKTSPPAS